MTNDTRRLPLHIVKARKKASVRCVDHDLESKGSETRDVDDPSGIVGVAFYRCKKCGGWFKREYSLRDATSGSMPPLLPYEPAR